VTAYGSGLAQPVIVESVVVGATNVKIDFHGDPNEIVDDGNEPNNTPAAATILGNNDYFRLEHQTLHAETDRDFFRWTAIGNGTLWVRVASDHSIVGGELRVLTAGGEQTLGEITLNDNYEEIRVGVDAGSEYLVEVSGGGNLVNRDYLLQVVGIFPPETRPDGAITAVATPIELDVLSNDDPIVGRLNELTLAVQTAPTNGRVDLLPEGQVRYSPNPGFVGVDTFTYEIRNTQSFQRAASGNVVIHVGVMPSHNSRLKWDVNGDGNITPRDALSVINKIAREMSADSLPIEVDITHIGPDYYDVNGDGEISPRDALFVINELARRLF
jgi:hypothetical protein